MDRISDKRKCMAALAVFRDLYEKKQDIYTVISEFIKLAIAERALSSFDLPSITNAIRQDYGFDLPIAVVKTSLRRLPFLDHDGKIYILKDGATFDAKEIRENTGSVQQENQKILDSLCVFVESKTNRSLMPQERESLCGEFCAYILDDNYAQNFGELISQFILVNSKDEEFVNQLNQIRQGVVIYVGLNYNTNYNAVDKIDSILHIYLDTELLFHMYGLNGELYKDLFDEFYDLVLEINKKARKQIVRLRYFTENQDEVDAYFRIAERIVRREEILKPGHQAMQTLVNGCSDAYEVVNKKADFYEMLKDKDITLDSQEHYYDKESNYEYIIDATPFYQNKEDDITDEDIDRKVNLLNYISIKRGIKSQKVFRNIGHILLSANKVTFKVAFDSSVREPNTVPLATNLTFLTNRFWLTLNKGLSSLSSLKSINVITKAQIALSAKINDNVGKLYNQFVEKDRVGEFDERRGKACLAELHKTTVKPDDINADNTDSYIEILSYNDIQTYIAEKEILEAKMKAEQDRIVKAMDDMKVLREAELEEHNKILEKNEQQLVKAAGEIASNRNEKEKALYNAQFKNK